MTEPLKRHPKGGFGGKGAVMAWQKLGGGRREEGGGRLPKYEEEEEEEEEMMERKKKKEKKKRKKNLFPCVVACFPFSALTTSLAFQNN